MVTLRTERLVLREFREDDWRSVHEYARDRAVCRLMEWGPNTPKQTRDFVRSVLTEPGSEPRLNFNLIATIERRVVGAVRLSIRSRDDREADLGYVINRRFWGSGYATEASRAVLEFGFRKLRLHRIYATCEPSNAASVRVLEKIGMKREGHLREHKLVKGRWRDSLVYAMLEQEWRSWVCNRGLSRRPTRD